MKPKFWFPQRVIGVEQTGDEQVKHTETDWRPLVSFAIYAVFTITALIISEVTK